MRRTAVLVLLLAVGAVLVTTIEAPRRRTGAERARGPHVLRSSAHGIRRLDVTLDQRRFAAERAADGWELDGVRASPAVADALEDLASLLAGLRAIDAFHPDDPSGFGFDPPAATILVTTRHRRTRLTVGALTVSGSTVYVRRDDDTRVFQLGVYLLSALERVFDARARAAA